MVASTASVTTDQSVPAAGETSSLEYRPEIDGLRAVAVIPVVLFHLGIVGIPGGYLGVDVFFVISGFLITSILKRELIAGNFSFRAFWARRIRRILPPLLAMTAATLIVTFGFAYKLDRPEIGAQAAAALASVANIYFWRVSGDYWGSRAESSPLLHTWSLSVEEQFYLLFPVLLWLVFRYDPRRLPQAVLLVIGISVPLFLWGSSAHPAASFYLPATRAWELAAGCFLAAAQPAPRARSPIRAGLALAGLGAVVASYLLLPRPGGAVIGTVVGASFIIAFGRYGLCNTLLANRPMVHLGAISYSLYLWHWPVLVFADYFRLGGSKAILLAPIYALALLSYYLVEKSTRRRPGIMPAIAAAYLVVLLGSVALSQADPFYDTSGFDEALWIPNDCNPHLPDDRPRNSVFATTKTVRRPVPPDAYRRGGLIFGDGDARPEIVLLGDSHASMWSETIVRISTRHRKKISVWAMDGVSPFMEIPLEKRPGESELSADEQYDYYSAVLESIRAWKPRLVIISAVWMRKTESEVEDLLTFLESHSANTLLIEQPPVLEYRDRNVMQHLAYLGIEPEDTRQHYLPIDQLEKCLEGRRLVKRLADRFARVGYVPTWDVFARDSQALVLDGRKVVYLDEDHLLFFGTELAAPRLEQAILDSLQNGALVPQ